MFDLGLGVHVEPVGPHVADGVAPVLAVLLPAAGDQGLARVRDEGFQLASALEVGDLALARGSDDLEVGFLEGVLVT